MTQLVSFPKNLTSQFPEKFLTSSFNSIICPYYFILAPAPPRKTRGELYKDVDADYYGYRDEDDGVLVPLEQDAEREAIARAMDEWERRKEEGEFKTDQEQEEDNIYAVSKDNEESDDEMEADQTADESQSFVAHVPVPSQKEVEEMLVQRKKMELLEKYASETLMQQSQEAKALLGL